MNRLKEKIIDNRFLLFCFGVFFLAQLMYSYAHAGFYTNYYSAFNQVGIDVPATMIIKHHFWQSMWYYHINPPLYAFYSYLFLFKFPPDGQLGVYFLHTTLGLLAVNSLFHIFKRFRVHVYLACFLICSFILSPTFNFSQTMGWYDFPTLCLLLISTSTFISFLDLSTFKNGLKFFVCIALLCSIRSLYHLVLYFVPLICILLIAVKKDYKTILLSAALPFLFVFALYFKNYYLFHAFTINSFSGEVIANAAMQQNVTLKDRYAGIKAGFFSDLALCPQSADTIPTKEPNFAYTGYYCYNVVAEKYRQAYIQRLGTDYHDIPLLQEIPNNILKHRSVLGNIGMGMEYQRLAMQSIFHYPEAYIQNINASWRSYFTPYPYYFFENMMNARNFNLLFRWNILGHTGGVPDSIKFGSAFISTTFLTLFPLLIVFGLARLYFNKKWALKLCSIFFIGYVLVYINAINFSGFPGSQTQLICDVLLYFVCACEVILVLPFVYSWRGKMARIKSELDRTQKLTLILMLCNIVFTTVIIIFIAGNEQLRYRIYIDPLYLVLFGIFTQTLIEAI